MDEADKAAIHEIVLKAATRARSRVPQKVITKTCYRTPRWLLALVVIETASLVLAALIFIPR